MYQIGTTYTDIYPDAEHGYILLLCNDAIKTMDELLTDALSKVVAGLSRADNHYTVTANYYDILVNGEPTQRWHIAHIWLHMDTSPLVELTPQGLVCDVRLSQHDTSIITRILLPFDQIWRVETISKDRYEMIYYRSDKLKLPDLQTNT